MNRSIIRRELPTIASRLESIASEEQALMRRRNALIAEGQRLGMTQLEMSKLIGVKPKAVGAVLRRLTGRR